MSTKTRREVALIALKTAFPMSIPVLAGYVFLGMSYGLLMVDAGFPVRLPILTALVIYTGSLEFLMIEILAAPFAPLATFMTALMVGARHIFYGISMLDRYRGMGWKKPYLVFACTDETFAVNYAAQIGPEVDRGWFYLWVSVLDQLYWVAGVVLGALGGSLVRLDTTGLDFVMCALFAVIFFDQWIKDSSIAAKKSMRGAAFIQTLKVHACEIIGVAGSAAALAVFGPDGFLVPAMVVILVALTVLRGPISEWMGISEKETTRERN